MQYKMSPADVIKLLHPDKTGETLSSAEYINKTHNERIEEINKACMIACDALSAQVANKAVRSDKNPLKFLCPVCGTDVIESMNYCCGCGQRLNFGD